MKKNLLVFAVIVSSCLFSTKSIAQREAGGSSEGLSATEPCPISFKRNDGNGTCGGDAQIRLSFNQHPVNAPVLIGIWYMGQQIAGIILPAHGDINELAKKGYISYCLDGRNIPPSEKITLQFRYQNGQGDCWLAEQ